jgi:hypothetical protein
MMPIKHTYPVIGFLILGYGSHFGLGLFTATNEP